MKSLLTLFALIVFNYSFAQPGIVPNGRFENWSIDTTLRSNVWTPLEGSFNDGTKFNDGTLKRVENAQNQAYAVQLTTKIINGDTVNPIIAYGNFENGLNGAPYSFPVDSLVFYAKFNVPANTVAEVIVLQFNNGVQTGSFIPITGTQNTWARLAMKLNTATQDSILIAVTSSPLFSDFDPIIGTTITVDNFSLKSITQGPALDDFSIEDFTQLTGNTPLDLTSSNVFAEFIGYDGNFVTRSEDKYEGLYAARLESIDVPDFGVFPGFVSNIFDDEFNETNGKPFTFQPDSLIGYYKYSPALNDTGYVYVNFTSNGQSVAEAILLLTEEQSTYKRFTLPITYTGVPDTMGIVAHSGTLDGSILFVDGFEFVRKDAGIREQFVVGASVYPNPSSDEILISVNTSPERIEIMDMQGKVVKTIANPSVFNKLSVADLMVGTYFIHTTAESGKTVNKFVKK